MHCIEDESENSWRRQKTKYRRIITTLTLPQIAERKLQFEFPFKLFESMRKSLDNCMHFVDFQFACNEQ